MSPERDRVAEAGGEVAAGLYFPLYNIVFTVSQGPCIEMAVIFNSGLKKSRIRETPNLSTDSDNTTGIFVSTAVVVVVVAIVVAVVVAAAVAAQGAF